MNVYDGKCDFCGRERLIHGQSMCDNCANLDEGVIVTVDFGCNCNQR